jgi:hypothetical protein
LKSGRKRGRVEIERTSSPLKRGAVMDRVLAAADRFVKEWAKHEQFLNVIEKEEVEIARWRMWLATRVNSLQVVFHAAFNFSGTFRPTIFVFDPTKRILVDKMVYFGWLPEDVVRTRMLEEKIRDSSQPVELCEDFFREFLHNLQEQPDYWENEFRQLGRLAEVPD